jgi:hypothetical protein
LFTQQRKPVIACLFDNTLLPRSYQQDNTFDFRHYREGFALLARQLAPISAQNIIQHALPVTDVTDMLHNRYGSFSRQQLQMQLFDIIQDRTADSRKQLQQRQQIDQLLTASTPTFQPTTNTHDELVFRPTPPIVADALLIPQQQLSGFHATLQNLVDPARLPQVIGDMQYYIQSSADMLGLLYDITFNAQSQAALDLTGFLFDYANKRKAATDGSNRIQQIIDITWLIHNTLYRLIEAGLVPARLFPLDWQQIVTADDVIVRNAPKESLKQLETLQLLFMKIMSLEVTNYQPHFSHDETDYHPYLGYADALGLELELPDITRTD